MRGLLLLLALTLALRLPFLNHAIQGDDAFFLSVAQHVQVDPLHPNHFVLRATGIDVDMRGHLHPPGNGWMLGALLALFGDIRETAFHGVYVVFSLGAVVFAWMLAKRFASDPFAAVFVFVATPAFVVNGNSLESDVPFLCFFLGAVAAWVEAVECDCHWALTGSVASMVAAALTSYQAVALIPVLAIYTWNRPRRWWHLLILTPAAAIVGLQVQQWFSTGALPIGVAQGHLSSHNYQSFENKLRNAVSMTTHLGWMTSPLLHLHWLAIPVAVVGGWFIDASPLFWLPFGIGASLLLRQRPTDFPRQWLLIFLAAAVAIFFAGSARYLLPLAVPLGIVTANAFATRRRLVLGATAAHLMLGLALAVANSQHWDRYREIVADKSPNFVHRRLWTNAEWGLRHYAESAGSMPMLHGQSLRPGDLVLTSALGPRIASSSGGGAISPLWEERVQPRLPFRLFGLDSRSGYSTNQRGFRAFDITNAPADIVRLDTVVERRPTLSYVAMDDPQVDAHIVSGIYGREAGPWRWTARRATLLLKPPSRPAPVEASIRLTPHATGRRVTLVLDGQSVAESTFATAGQFTLKSQAAVVATGDSATLAIVLDGTFRVPGDDRDLGVILAGGGFSR